ncbi:MAG: hypothetical protein ASARMPREDX12_009125 [Alectoria sarmentosa]|nr:MAG: hypothetical protein ASARMPREDX12_009125 [Alectoria sarmentosa]
MITGVETAGLVLAIFPLLVSALEHYQEGFESLSDWWKFRTEFLGFIHVIGRQAILFDENLEELLSPIITSDAEMDTLLRNPTGPSWRHAELEAKLRRRLPKSYESYRNAIDDMKETMDALQKKLGIQNGKLTWTDGANRIKWEYEFRRVRYVLSRKKREKLVGDLTANNEELQKLFTSSERLAPLRKRRRTPNAFKRIREQACGLYSVLATGWKCQCTDATPPHQANLLLEKRIDTFDRDRRAERADSSAAQLRVLFLLRTESRRFPLSWQDTEIKLIEAEAGHLLSLTSTNITTPTAVMLTGVTNTFEERAPDYLHPFKKSTKKIVFPQITVQPPPGSKGPNVPDLIEIADLCEAVRKAHRGTCDGPLGYLRDTQDRRHAFYPSIQPARFSENAETVTLASLLSKSPSSNNTDLKGAVSMTLSRLERYSIAVTLASSLLQLYSSPWIGETWSKYDIYFLIAAEGSTRPILVDKPYITRRFTSHSPQSSVISVSEQTGRNASTKSIQALGIMLLELCFGEAIEDQPIRSRYLGPDGRPNDMTDFCAAQHWLQHDALGEGGPEYSEAVRRCLFCAFGPKSTDLEDDELRSAIYSEVVEPLEVA